MTESAALSLALASGSQLAWVAVTAVGLWFAARARRENAPGAGRACGGFGALAVAGLLGGASAVLTTVWLTANGPSGFETVAHWMTLVSGSVQILNLVGHGLLIAAFVRAWGVSADPPDFDAPAPR